ncbi:MAG TPA: VWA domain-containing protein [Candidatus Acidoferrales bacterium]
MRIKHILITAMICIAGVSFAFAQSVPPPPPPSAPTPSPQSAVHVTTRVVQVTVTVHDDRGNPITGLRKDDFVLSDQGQRQQIASFSEQTNLVTTTRAAAPNVFTNKFEPGGPSQPPLTVIVLDTYNAGYWDSKLCPPPGGTSVCAIDPMFQAVKQFVSQMQPQDHVALYQLADTLYLLQDFTSDPNALLRGLEIARSHVTRFYPPAATDTLTMSNYTMNAMTVISKRLAFVSGRKNLIWLSNGFPYQRVITDEKIDKSAKILANAGLPLDAIDARGLAAPSGGGGGPVPHAAARGPVAGGGGPTPASGNYGVAGTSGGPLGQFNAMRNLAEESGGHAIRGTNDLAGAIRRVVDDSADTYILGYYPDHNKWNGEFREINVKVNRPGVELHYRKGYYAVADTASVPEIAAEKLTDAMKSPLESTELGFDVQADGVTVSDARQIKVKITVDANQLRFQQQGEQWTDTLSETWAEFNSVGQQVGEISKTIDLSHNADDYKKLLHDGFTYSKTLVLAKDASEVRLVLRDEGNGAIGSVIIPLWRLFAATTPLQPPTKQ